MSVSNHRNKLNTAEDKCDNIRASIRRLQDELAQQNRVAYELKQKLHSMAVTEAQKNHPIPKDMAEYYKYDGDRLVDVDPTGGGSLCRNSGAIDIRSGDNAFIISVNLDTLEQWIALLREVEEKTSRE